MKEVIPAPPVQEVKEVVIYPLKIKGTLTQLTPEHDYEFHAQKSTGEVRQELVRKTASSKLYRTVSTSAPKLIAHVVVPADSTDPVSDIYAEVERVVKDMRKDITDVKLPGRVMMNENGNTVVHNRKKQLITIRMEINLAETVNVQNELIRRMQAVSSCLMTNSKQFSKQLKVINPSK